MRSPARLLAFAALLVLASPAPARAAFHLMKVVEVFPGTAALPDAQYVVLQMYAAGQSFVGGHSVVVSDAGGAPIGSFTFSGSVPNGANQTRILVATPAAEALFGLTADLAMTAVLPLAGGKVCFDAIDCVAWGAYAPPGGDAAVGTPFHGASAPRPGLDPGRAIARRLDVAGGATTLEAADDTGDSAADWQFALPAPRNNAGQIGMAPPAACGSGALEGLEQCDDGGIVPGDGCSASCVEEFCGDGEVNDVVEECDDGNVTPGDGCEPDCTTVPEPAAGAAAALGALAALAAGRARRRARSR